MGASGATYVFLDVVLKHHHFILGTVEASLCSPVIRKPALPGLLRYPLQSRLLPLVSRRRLVARELLWDGLLLGRGRLNGVPTRGALLGGLLLG